MATTQQIAAGAPVFDARGAWVGTVSLHNAPGPHVLVQTGRLFPRDVYLSADAITHHDGDGVYLRLRKGDLKGQRFSRPTDACDQAASRRGGEPAVPAQGVVEPLDGRPTPSRFNAGPSSRAPPR